MFHNLMRVVAERLNSLDDKKIEIARWIKKVIENEQRSNFLFPRKIGGPDF